MTLCSRQTLPYRFSVDLPAAPLGQSWMVYSPSKVPTQDTLKNSFGQAIKRDRRLLKETLNFSFSWTVTARPTCLCEDVPRVTCVGGLNGFYSSRHLRFQLFPLLLLLLLILGTNNISSKVLPFKILYLNCRHVLLVRVQGRWEGLSKAVESLPSQMGGTQISSFSQARVMLLNSPSIFHYQA